MQCLVRPTDLRLRAVPEHLAESHDALVEQAKSQSPDGQLLPQWQRRSERDVTALEHAQRHSAQHIVTGDGAADRVIIVGEEIRVHHLHTLIGVPYFLRTCIFGPAITCQLS